MIEIQHFLNSRYEFYVNVFSGKTHYKSRNVENEEFRPINDYFFNSLYIEMRKEGISIAKDNLRSILHSDFVPLRNPFLHFVDLIDEGNNEDDYIAKIASTINTTNDKFFHWVFKKWFVGMVACILNPKVANENMLILLGKQGVGKTRWLESLLPEELSEYYYSGEINPINKDHLALFSSKIIINLDELTSFSASRIEAFKSLLSEKTLTFRRPYGTYNEDFQRIASVVGTSNHKDILMDTTKNRRYLCIEALKFSSINKNDLKRAYKQAVGLYKTDFLYYFSDAEIDEVNAVNMAYMKADEGTDIINKYLEVCETDHSSAMFMNATEVLQYLKDVCKEDIKLGVSRLGRLLSDFEFKTKKIRGINKYALLLKPSVEEAQVQETVKIKKDSPEDFFGNVMIPMYTKQSTVQTRN